MKKLLFLSLVLILLASLLMTGCGESDETTTSSTTETPDVIELTMSWPTTEVPLYQVSFGKFIEAVEERTDGRVKITEYFAGQLVPPEENYDAVVRGTHDIACGWIGLHPERFRHLEVVQLTKVNVPFAAVNPAINELFQTTAEIQGEVADTKLLAMAASGNASIGTMNRQINTVEDFQGLKLHAESKLAASMLEKLGAAPMSVMPNELYTNLQRKIIDGGTFMTEMLYAMNLQEILDYWAMPYPMANGIYTVMNIDTWNSLPADIQQIVEEAAQEFVPTGFNDFFLDNEALDVAADEYGVEITTFSQDVLAEMQEAQDEVRAEWVADMAADGLDGEGILEAWDALCEKHSG